MRISDWSSDVCSSDLDPQHPPLFRRASADCARVVDWRSGSGRNRAGEPGWVHIAECRTPAGADMQVVVGWSQRPDPVTWQGGRVSGIIAPDSQHIIRLVSDRAAAGLEPAQPPRLDDVPNNPSPSRKSGGEGKTWA